jgi:hypothetical protein
MARTVVFGKSGSGKSWYVGQRLGNILEPDDPDDEFERAVHMDLEDEEKGLSQKGDALLLTFECDKEDLRRQVVVDPDDPPDYIPEKELDDGPIIYLPKWVLYKNDYVRVVPNGLNDKEQVKLCEMLADAAMRAGDCHFSMDEAHRVANQGDMGQKMNNLITGGRKRGVEWAFITQRPQLIHKTLIAQANHGVFFKLTSGRDIKKADKLAESFDAEDVLPGLPDRVAIVENYSTGESVRIDTNDLERKYEHVAGDDGKADEQWAKGGEDFGNIEEAQEPSDDDDGDSEDSEDGSE